MSFAWTNVSTFIYCVCVGGGGGGGGIVSDMRHTKLQTKTTELLRKVMP